jgi:hypothetical protein
LRTIEPRTYPFARSYMESIWLGRPGALESIRGSRHLQL